MKEMDGLLRTGLVLMIDDSSSQRVKQGKQGVWDTGMDLGLKYL